VLCIRQSAQSAQRIEASNEGGALYAKLSPGASRKMTLGFETKHDAPRRSHPRDDFGELERQITDDAGAVVHDLDEVTLVDIDAVRFPRDAEVAGVELRRCPPSAREMD
jgi:hypothetical protein